ncbi:hypothetical protein [Cyanobium sp. BA20m-p-22]|uniref:hypothetical protein n=1 Tax=Cyanobium sp. BA20m-p-22 TaxID=2823704 RepID=UPI0020CF88C1|nr:hypothetical protein [Cyanobium sp. BA20m-p-22]
MGNPISRELFLERARFRFGNQYDYAEIIYKSYKTPVRIRCTTHPVKQISITPEKHLQTTGGCKYCLREMRIASLERELNRASPARRDLVNLLDQPLIQQLDQSPIQQPEPQPAPVFHKEK